MALTKKQLLSEALNLNARDRESLAEKLWQTINAATKDERWDAWAAELRK